MSESPSHVELRAKSVRFFSQGDEAAFFAWLATLKCVERHVGQGLTLFISVRAAEVDEEGLRELLALFHRYEVDLRQLAVFDRSEFASWFRDEHAYWYNRIFG